MMTRRARFRWAALGLAVLAVGVALGGCRSTYPQRDPTGERLPSVVGTSLADDAMRLPEDLAGEPALLLVGYQQRTQFDLDRWILGMDQAGIRVRTLEVPTIPGFFPGLFQGAIDSGMRSGIPEEDWVAVVTLYDDADRIAEFTGNENGLPGRVLLIDGDGIVTFFHDRGYSAGSLNALREALEGLRD